MACGMNWRCVLMAGLFWWARALTDLNILGLLPMTGESWRGGPSVLTAVTLALEHINARPDILPGYQLKLIYGNSECDAGKSTYVLNQMLLEEPVKLMILGAACSPASEATAQFSHLWNLTQLSYGSSSPSLSDKKRFPRFFRVSSPLTNINPARIALMKMMKWKRIATITQPIELFSKVTDNMVPFLHRENISLISSEIFQDDPSSHVRNLKKHDARIIIGGFYEDRALRVFCAAYKEGLYGPKVVWFLVSWYSENWYRSVDDSVGCTSEQIEVVLQSAVYTGDSLKDQTGLPSISGYTWTQFQEQYYNRTNQTKLSGDHYRIQFYDSAWAIALALNCTVNFLNDTGSEKRLEDFQYSDGFLSDVITNCTRQVAFYGHRGYTKFDIHGDPSSAIAIDQQYGSGRREAYIYKPELPEGERLVEINGMFWKNGKVPRDAKHITVTKWYVPQRVYIPLTVLATLGICLALSFLAFNVTLRNKRIIKMSSPIMNNVILVGCVVVYGTVYFQQQPSFSADVVCALRKYLFIIGFSLVFGSLFSKTWRVHVIFASKTTKKVNIRDIKLLLLIAGFVSVNMLVLVIWECVSPEVNVISNSTVIMSPQDDDMVLQLQMEYCDSPLSVYFLVTLYIIQGTLMAFGTFLAWETRKVRIEAVNDSRLIGICIYNVFLLSALGVALNTVLQKQVDLLYGINSGFIIFGTTVTQCVLFVPKVIFVVQNGTNSSEVYPTTSQMNGVSTIHTTSTK